eukprot:CAMPEP_0197906472 /NCGR_PEP_ID=MMETSP1439-20131203/62707_1 /TAXON_ID=66791 /ORGANISM="Gonyaulax spinifera, Strain CCMP409" /LENGTH=232 /DNA_ID=CAMNT_0043527831 /DNA_START=70 /DNA_END=765 /DNA_ORIENTATION=+
MEAADAATRSPAAVMEAYEAHSVDTPVGPVETKLCLPAGTPVALAVLIHGMSPERDIVWEWGCIVEELRQRKTAVVFPSLHTCDRTAPAAGVAADVTAALAAVTAWAREKIGSSPPVVVYGKSWGGARAVEFAASAAATDVAGLCLACPSTQIENRAEQIASLTVPTLLAWARDDKTIPFEVHEQLLEELRARKSGATVFVPVKEGGHRVDRMAAGDSGLAAKLAEWPDLAL